MTLQHNQMIGPMMKKMVILASVADIATLMFGEISASPVVVEQLLASSKAL